MDDLLKTSLWKQFGAAIDMLGNAVRLCPDELWTAPLWPEGVGDPGYSRFWYLSYHSLFWLDLYLSGAVEGFEPPPPFTLGELEAAGYPDRMYDKDVLLAYLEHGRSKCQVEIEALTEAKAERRCMFPWGELSYLELLLYNLRHVQEHASQLNLLLGQNGRQASKWVGWAGK